MNKLKAVHIDGILIFAIGFFGSIQLAASADSAYNYVPKEVVFWTRIISGAIVGGCSPLIGFRNQTYGKWLADKPQIPPLQPPQIPATSATETKTQL